MLLDMLTADAAKHGHEYSPTRRSPSPAHNGSFLTQMPLSIFTSVLRGRSGSPAPANGSTTNVESLLPDAPASAEPQDSLMKAARETSVTSPTPSRPASSGSTASADGKPKKRARRPKTTYNLANPPPTTHPRSKLHIRPKILLQLHQVIPSQRPKPVYEVIPFSLLAPRSTRRLARTFNSRERLGHDDLLIVKAEEYGHRDNEATSDDERWGMRDVIGVICPGRDEKGTAIKAEVCMDDGTSWEVTNTPNGGYEFSYTDDHGLTLRSRWVPKGAHIRRVSTMSSMSQASPITPADDKKFTFSTISANSRRHPIIATMSRSSIDVLDSYTMPTATSPPTPSLPSSIQTPMATPSSIDMNSFIDIPSDHLPVRTDDALRRFIVVSGIWVAFSENWSSAYSSSKSHCPSPLASSATFRPAAPNRAVSMSFLDSPRSASPSSVDENRRSIPRIFRTGTQKLHRNASFTNSTASPISSKTSPVSSPLKTRSRRSNSTGNADITSKTGSTKKRFGLALEDQTLPETEEERQSKRSIEILRIKELQLPSPSQTSPVQSHAPTPQIVEPTSTWNSSPPLSSPPSPDPSRQRKTQSAYNPVTTAGLWDSGVADGPGLKARPTSMVVVNEKKKKEKRKQERSKSKEKRKEGKEKEGRRTSERLKERLLGIFHPHRKDKSSF